MTVNEPDAESAVGDCYRQGKIRLYVGMVGYVSLRGKDGWIQRKAHLIIISLDDMKIARDGLKVFVSFFVADVACAEYLLDLSWDLAIEWINFS
jgi:hypothetical protein